MAHVRTMVGTMLEQDWELPLASSKEDCWNITVDDTVDPGAARTNQRAELLAAIAGLNKLKESYEEDRGEYIVVTDSEYVVKGITEWFPTWRSREWRTSNGKQPTNLDLFCILDEDVTKLEQDGFGVGFWHIPSAFNHRADKLAKLAAKI